MAAKCLMAIANSSKDFAGGAPSMRGVRVAVKCLMATANSSKDFAGGAPSTSGVGVAAKCLMATANSYKDFALTIVVLIRYRWVVRSSAEMLWGSTEDCSFHMELPL
jgi:hypothetical protein